MYLILYVGSERLGSSEEFMFCEQACLVQDYLTLAQVSDYRALPLSAQYLPFLPLRSAQSGLQAAFSRRPGISAVYAIVCLITDWLINTEIYWRSERGLHREAPLIDGAELNAGSAQLGFARETDSLQLHGEGS